MERPAERPRRREEERMEAGFEAFQDRHSSLADRVECGLMRLIVLGLVALALAQLLQLSRFNRLAALEGVPVHELADWSRSLSSRQASPEAAAGK